MGDNFARHIMKILVSYNCSTDLSDLQSHDKILSREKWIDFFENYDHIFKVFNLEKIAFSVTIAVQVPLCEDYCRPDNKVECKNVSCQSLHICKFFLLSQCTFKSCRYGHVLHTEHNQKVLGKFLMNELTDEEIKCVLVKLWNRTPLMIPTICHFYNVKSGCSKQNCQFLHICKNLVDNDCKFGPQCKRNHDVFNHGVNNVLQKYGCDISHKTKLEILEDIRCMFGSKGALQLPKVKPVVIQRPKSKSGVNTKFTAGLPNDTLNANVLGARPKEMSKQRGFLGPQPKEMSKQLGLLGPRPKEMSKHRVFLGQVHNTEAKNQQDSVSAENEKEDICLYFLRNGKCWFGRQCHKHHTSMIYQWQFSMQSFDHVWKDFTDEENIYTEMKYCQPDINQCFLKKPGQNDVSIRFDQMTGENLYSQIRIRRLSTLSSESSPVPPIATPLTNVWYWYWKNENNDWVKYGEKTDTSHICEATSNSIEAQYIEYPNSIMTFKTEHFDYAIDFTSMKQKNNATGTTRQIIRRPLFFKKEDLEQRAKTASKDTLLTEVPPDWKTDKFTSAKNLLRHFQIQQVDKTSSEYHKVETMFYKTIDRSTTIKQIERIENGDLWSNFDLKRSSMTTKAGSPIKELNLFHGTTRDIIDSICHQGFEFRFSGDRVGARFGQGSYFARDAAYSNCYAQGDEMSNKKMFVARVLVGEYTKGSKENKRPPGKNTFDLYDSCVDDVSDPTIHVIFNLDQSYPDYIITYASMAL